MLLAVSALLAGALNAVAGGGTFLTFPALLYTGVPPVAANATSTVALLPGYLSGAYGFRHEVGPAAGLGVPWQLATSLLGGLAGSLLLLVTPNEVFHAGRSDEIAAQFADPWRYARTLACCAEEFVRFGKSVPLLLALLVVLACVCGPARRGRDARAAALLLAASGAVLLAYVPVYVASPYPPEEHTGGYHRLLMQMWPAAVIALLLLAILAHS